MGQLKVSQSQRKKNQRRSLSLVFIIIMIQLLFTFIVNIFQTRYYSSAIIFVVMATVAVLYYVYIQLRPEIKAEEETKRPELQRYKKIVEDDAVPEAIRRQRNYEEPTIQRMMREKMTTKEEEDRIRTLEMARRQERERQRQREQF